MANYLKGIGDAATRFNEILPSFDARINTFILGHTAGILKNEYNEFASTAIDRGVIIKGGMMQAYGFFGCADTDTQINFVMPSTTQYIHIFAEIDLSVVPNRFEIKATAMSNSATWTPRQDNLKTVPNGKYQFHLWQVTLTATTITLTDKRAFIAKPANSVTAEEYTASGGIATKFSGVESSIATTKSNLETSIAARLPKLTLLTSSKSYTITASGVGATTIALNSGTSVADGDMVIVNARCTNFGTFAFCGTLRISTSHEARLSFTLGGNGMPFNCVDVFCVTVKIASATTLTLGGYCRTRVRNDTTDSANGRTIQCFDAAYTIDSIYKINL